MKNKKAAALLLAMVIAGSTVSGSVITASAAGTAAYTKDENIYGILDSNGKLEELYVVNQFEVTKAGEITDYGSYDTVTNLTNTEKIASDSAGNTFNAGEGNFYYQGISSDGQLPWRFSIKYYLNGVEVSPEVLAGATGDIRIHFVSKQNKNVDPVFYENFMLQVSMTLDNDRVSDIKAPDATIADAGTSRQVNFTVMPGKDGNINLEAKVERFEMSGISIAAIPFSMSIDLPDTDAMTGDMTELADGIAELNDGVGELKDGMKEYVDGISEFNDGVQQMNSNYASLANGGSDLVSGSAQMEDGLDQLKSSGSQITAGSSKMADTLSGFGEKVAAMDLSGLSPEDAGYLTQIAQALSENYASFHEGLVSYAAGVGQLAGNYSSFHSGLEQYTGGVSKMGSGISAIADGSNKITSGGKELYKGVSELKDGTQEMAEGVADMPEKMDEKVDEMMSDYIKDFTLVSFTDEKNEEINAVQFTITTPEIKRDIREKEIKEEKKLGFFERLMALFQ